jgi:hypothetical protein
MIRHIYLRLEMHFLCLRIQYTILVANLSLLHISSVCVVLSLCAESLRRCSVRHLLVGSKLRACLWRRVWQ